MISFDSDPLFFVASPERKAFPRHEEIVKLWNYVYDNSPVHDGELENSQRRSRFENFNSNNKRSGAPGIKRVPNCRKRSHESGYFADTESESVTELNDGVEWDTGYLADSDPDSATGPDDNWTSESDSDSDSDSGYHADSESD